MSEVTQVIQAIGVDRAKAARELIPLVYDELRKLARSRLSDEAPNQSLQATELVHEAYLRLVGQSDLGWENRAHFFAAAAEAMRRILIEKARSKGRVKRGGDRVRLELLDHVESIADDPSLILSLDELLTRLQAECASAAQIASLHLFGGLSIDDAAKALGASRSAAYQNWRYARAWLRNALDRHR